MEILTHIDQTSGAAAPFCPPPFCFPSCLMISLLIKESESISNHSRASIKRFDHIGRRIKRFGTLLVIKYINERVKSRGEVDRRQIISFPLIRFNLNLHQTRWQQAVLAVETLA